MAHPVVISPTVDSATVDSALWLIAGLRKDGHTVETTADLAAEHLADAVAQYGYDPTDAELEVAWNGPDSHAAHRAAWALHVEARS